jgi:hypothetical protein
VYRSFAERDTDKIGFISDGITPLLIYEKKQAIRIDFNITEAQYLSGMEMM